MKIDACYQLGYVQDTHGLKGYVQVNLDVDDPKPYYKMESVFLSPPGLGDLIPFFVEEVRPQGHKLLIKFEEYENIDQAKQLVGHALYLPLDFLPDLEPGSFYHHDLIGAQVSDQNLGLLGTITSIYDQTPQLVLGMEYQQKEVLIPYTEEVVQKFDQVNGKLMVTLPAGLLDIYLSDES